MGGCRLLYFVQSKMVLNAIILLFYVFLCQYVHFFVYPEMARRGKAPLVTPLNPPQGLAYSFSRAAGPKPGKEIRPQKRELYENTPDTIADLVLSSNYYMGYKVNNISRY